MKISAETRGAGFPTAGNRGQGPPPPPPPMSNQERLRYVWGILWECTQAANTYTNLDFGGETRFHNQQELHDAIKGLLPRSAGSMHTRVSPTWDLGTAIRFAESIGYNGLYTIEVKSMRRYTWSTTPSWQRRSGSASSLRRQRQRRDDQNLYCALIVSTGSTAIARRAGR